jgi:hypothetical protein
MIAHFFLRKRLPMLILFFSRKIVFMSNFIKSVLLVIFLPLLIMLVIVYNDHNPQSWAYFVHGYAALLSCFTLLAIFITIMSLWQEGVKFLNQNDDLKKELFSELRKKAE